MPRPTHAPPPALADIGHTLPTLRSPAQWVPGRTSRVTTLIIAILLASLADLALTLTFLTSVGMSEANPVARAIISTGSIALVVAFKLALSAAACAIFWIARRRTSGEIGALAGALLMAWLIVRWHDYIDQSYIFTAGLDGKQHQYDSRWVALGE